MNKPKYEVSTYRTIKEYADMEVCMSISGLSLVSRASHAGPFYYYIFKENDGWLRDPLGVFYWHSESFEEATVMFMATCAMEGVYERGAEA